MKKALVIIDMLNDFVDGKLANRSNADKIIPNIQTMLSIARSDSNWVVVFSNDNHSVDDVELKIWGEHAMEGTKGADVIDELKPMESNKEWISFKHFYGAFEDTQLADELKEEGVGTVVLTGQHTNCCVRHSAYGALRNGFDIEVLDDCVAPPPGVEDNQEALKYLEAIYGAKIISSENYLLS